MATKSKEAPLPLQEKLESVIRQKVPEYATQTIAGFDRMRDVRLTGGGFEIGTFYLGDLKDEPARQLVEGYMHLADTSLTISRAERAEPPHSLDTVSSLKAKIALAERIDPERIVSRGD